MQSGWGGGERMELNFYKNCWEVWGVVQTGEYLTMAQCSQWTGAVRIRISGDENSKHHQIVFQRPEREREVTDDQVIKFVKFSFLRHINTGKYWNSLERHD